MRITSAGNVGIGISPQSILETFGASPIVTITDSNTFSSGVARTSGIEFKAYNPSGNITTQSAGIYGVITPETGYTPNQGYLAFYTRLQGGSYTEKMIITSGGNVGIGTTSPATKLEVIGTIRTSGTGGQLDLDINVGALRFYDGSTFRGGFGTDEWATAGSSANLITYLNGGNYHIYSTTTASKIFTALSGGNVGIGTTSPTTKLQVAGETTTSILTAANETNGQFQSRINGNSVNSQGACRWRTYARGIVATGTGTKLNIPFTSQGNLNIVTVARVLVCSADFNSSYGGSAQFMFSVGSLNALSNLQILSSGGNYSSATTSGMNVVVTLGGFAAAYIVIEYLTPEPSYSIDLGNITLTS
jgi:hypothetical protein